MKNQILTRALCVLSSISLLTSSDAHTCNLNRRTLKDKLSSMEALCPETSFQERLSQQKLFKQLHGALRRQNQEMLTLAIKNILAFALITKEQLDDMLRQEITTADEKDSKEWIAFLQTKIDRSASPTTSSDERKI